ncbi:hypothetical protein [Legionella waltersii]|uniref:Uncharacterized protein n=1 Tax=Legionella waltersii TaxID=66969 RepID=A0A0W0ZZZ7_9GAMM|nr:hypothetical protein [Legionella waltersii]KTD74693.1 hypothetical protein Lwal_2734 [Legionella waltersii]SNV09258.1 Uncharacterised protein [Legionella waltersii]
MKTNDPALSFSNPRLLAAIYFGLLSVVGTILINALLTTIGIEEIIPVYQAVILGMIVSSCTAAIFGESIVHCKYPYKRKVFWLGFAMVMCSLPIFDLGIVFLMREENAKLFAVTSLSSMVLFYLVTLAYSYVLFGVVLAVASGLAAMYLRSQLVYDILHTTTRRHEKHALAKSKATHRHKEH